MTAAVVERPAAQTKQTLVAKFASKYSIEPERLLTTLKATAFRQNGSQEISNEQMAALLIVADQYGLNPFTREIYAFPDKSGIVPVVGVDGWSRIINEHPQSDGFEFVESDETTTFEGKTVPVWMEVHIYRKDRQRPIKVRERFAEVVRSGMQPWKTHPSRMLRHKVLIQGARLAYGFAGIFDEDEAERIVTRDMGSADVVTGAATGKTVQMPQSRSRSATQGDQTVIDMSATGAPASAPVSASSAKSENPSPAPAPVPSSSTAALASEGERAWVKRKLDELGLDLKASCEEVGVTNFDALTEDGFIALKDLITRLERN